MYVFMNMLNKPDSKIISMKDKNDITKLINSFSIKEIIEIFMEIDDKIISLHECSSEDFLSLNTNFKKYFKISRNISDNARQILEIVLGKDNNSALLNDLSSSYEKLKYYIETFNDKTLKIISDLGKMQNFLSHQFVVSNNFMQDLMTLKLLVANLELQYSSQDQKEGNKIPQQIISLKVIAEKGCQVYIEFQKKHDVLKKDINKNLINIEKIRETNYDSVNSLLDQIKLSEKLLMEKHQEAIPRIPSLTEKTENTADSIEKIITSLQYHDIIKQKIDHIQKAHQDIIKDLVDIDLREDNEENKIQKQVESFSKIRDIAGLQAAQLINANKEYQQAIGIITDKFLDVGDDMINISALCLVFAGTANKSHESYFERLNYNLEDSTNNADHLIRQNAEFKEKIKQISLSIEYIASDINNIIEVDDQLRRICETQEPRGEILNSEKTLRQIQNLCLDINTTSLALHQYYIEIFDLSEEVNTTMKKFCFENKIEENLKYISQNLNDIIITINENNKKIYTLLAHNRELSMNVTTEIKQSIKEIKYYDYFKKTIEEIVLKLSNINAKLNSAKESGIMEKIHNLDYLKENYTMESEHEIHDNVSTSDNIDILKYKKSLNSEKNNKDNQGNIELF
jgi:hypothetical protein